MSDRTLYILRHGQTEWNVGLRMQGRRDSALTELGRVQADLHGRTLARHGGVDRLYASPLGRTRDTAALVNAHLDVPVSYRHELVERDCGDWSGLTLQVIETAYPDEWRARSDDPYFHRPPAGENLEDMEARVGDLIDALLEAPERRIALVTHGVMSRVIIKRLLDLEPRDAVDVRHPNELFYRVTVGAAEQPDSAYFLEGRGPLPGLLRKNEGETILGR
ncbi:MAG: histidine phosphatase family protein [Pseudomonadales bacterium]